MNIILHVIGGDVLFYPYPPAIIGEMTATALAVSPGTPGRIRSLNPMRDLSAVADLVELCFKAQWTATANVTCRICAAQQRTRHSCAGRARLPNWVSPLTGYVWEDNGRIIGNVSLIPYFRRNKRVFLIANVATHPDYRRRGIGRMLTDKAMKHAREKLGWSLAARARGQSRRITLYEDLGFREHYRRTTFHFLVQRSPSSASTGHTDSVPPHSGLG